MRKSSLLTLCGLSVLYWASLVFDGTEGALVAGRDGAVTPENTIETIAQTEKRLKKLVNSGFKMVLPYLVPAATEIKLNRECIQGLLFLLRGVMDIKDWAIKMVDALGKPSAGMLEGTATAMGDYDECLDIVVPKKMRPPPSPPYTENQIAFHGQYCVVQIHLPEAIRRAAMAWQAGNRTNSELANTKTFLRNLIKIAPRADVADFRLGVCLPSICDKRDLQAIVDEIMKIVKLDATAIRCETKKKLSYTSEQIAILCVIGLMAFLVALGTGTDLILRITHDVSVDKAVLENKSMLIQSLVAFSITRNTQKMVSFTGSDNSKISCLRGMKFISICLYVVVWTYATPQDFHFLKYRSAFYFHKFLEDWWFTVFANASVGADTLFVIAGLQVSYRLWWKSKSGRVNISIPKYILKWYSRFTLSQIIVISLFLCLPLIGNGPIWGDVVAPVIENCKQRWWMNILAINNFWPSDLTCLPHTWLVCCIFHLMLLSPILLFILSKYTSIGIFVNVIIILGSSAAIAMVTLMNSLPPAPAFYFMSFINIKTIWQKLFIQAYDHISPFCIGILLGFFLNRFDKIELKKTTVAFGWCTAITCNLTVLCGLYGYRHGEIMEITLSAIYASVHRTVWSVGIVWIIFACAYGYGGFVNTILSWKVLVPFDRLANLTYLLHPLVLFLHEGQLRERMYMAHLDQAMYAIAYIVLTVFIAGICYVVCVAPFEFFETKLWYYEEHTDCFLEEKVEKLPEKLKSVTIDCKKEKCSNDEKRSHFHPTTTFTDKFGRICKS